VRQLYVRKTQQQERGIIDSERSQDSFFKKLSWCFIFFKGGAHFTHRVVARGGPG
jgi:hypothetical protein